MPPRTRNVSPFRTGLYAAQMSISAAAFVRRLQRITFQEVGLEVNIEDVTTQTLDGVVERQNMNSFSVLDVETLMYADEVAKFDSQIVTSNFVHLNAALFNVIRTQANQYGIASLLATIVILVNVVRRHVV